MSFLPCGLTAVIYGGNERLHGSHNLPESTAGFTVHPKTLPAEISAGLI